MDASSSDEFEVEDVSQAKQKGLPFSKKQSEVLESFRGKVRQGNLGHGVIRDTSGC